MTKLRMQVILVHRCGCKMKTPNACGGMVLLVLLQECLIVTLQQQGLACALTLLVQRTATCDNTQRTTAKSKATAVECPAIECLCSPVVFNSALVAMSNIDSSPELSIIFMTSSSSAPGGRVDSQT